MSKKRRGQASSAPGTREVVVWVEPTESYHSAGKVYEIDVSEAVPEGYQVTHVTGACQDRATLEWAFVIERRRQAEGKTVVQLRWSGVRATRPRLWLHCEPMPAPASADAA